MHKFEELAKSLSVIVFGLGLTLSTIFQPDTILAEEYLTSGPYNITIEMVDGIPSGKLKFIFSTLPTAANDPKLSITATGETESWTSIPACVVGSDDLVINMLFIANQTQRYYNNRTVEYTFNKDIFNEYLESNGHKFVVEFGPLDNSSEFSVSSLSFEYDPVIGPHLLVLDSHSNPLITPDILDLGDVDVGGSQWGRNNAWGCLLLKNAGTDPLTINLTITDNTEYGDFLIATPHLLTINFGESRLRCLRFFAGIQVNHHWINNLYSAPPGQITGTLTIEHNAPNVSSPYNISVLANVLTPKLIITDNANPPNSIDVESLPQHIDPGNLFPPWDFGYGDSERLIFTNEGNGTLRIYAYWSAPWGGSGPFDFSNYIPNVQGAVLLCIPPQTYATLFPVFHIGRINEVREYESYLNIVTNLHNTDFIYILARGETYPAAGPPIVSGGVNDVIFNENNQVLNFGNVLAGNNAMQTISVMNPGHETLLWGVSWNNRPHTWQGVEFDVANGPVITNPERTPPNSCHHITQHHSTSYIMDPEYSNTWNQIDPRPNQPRSQSLIVQFNTTSEALPGTYEAQLLIINSGGWDELIRLRGTVARLLNPIPRIPRR